MKDALSYVFKIFTTVATGMLLVISLIFLINRQAVFDANILWQILLVAALTAITSLFYYLYRIPFVIRIVVHYLMVCGIVSLMGFAFNWFSFDVFADYVVMVVSVTVVYAAAFIVGQRALANYCNKINSILNERNKKQ